MSIEQQIEEMLNEICVNCPYLLCCEDEHLKDVCRFAKVVNVLYSAGYRKQSEDVVEVVRCKNCRWFVQRHYPEGYDGNCEISGEECCNDYFCNHGERKEQP